MSNTWYEEVREYTERLVQIRSISPSEGENEAAHEVLRLLCADGLESVYTACGLDAVENDLYARQNVYAFLRGEQAATLILLGHFDTVETKDYGTLEQWALQPGELAARLDELLGPDQADEQRADDWMYGRGSFDMKSGLAVNLVLMRHLAKRAQTSQLPFSVVMLAVPDEENESAGVLQAVNFLLRLREEHGLTYLGVINTDSGPARYDGDPNRYIFNGAMGKLLPSFLCVGRESHVGTPFSGLDVNVLAAELIRDLSMNDELCDSTGGLTTVPPVTLHATDLKTHYDVQLPFVSYFYLNVITLTTDPATLLERLQERSEKVLAQVLERVYETGQRWKRKSGDHEVAIQALKGVVLTYAELYRETVQRLGEQAVQAELAAEWERWPATLDKRERSLHLTHRLWTLSRRQGPAVVLYYAPPYYPHVPPRSGLLYEAITGVMQAHPEQKLTLLDYYPYLTDMSYPGLEPGMEIAALQANMPIWQTSDTVVRPGGYHLPLEAMRQIGMPVFDWGPYGTGAHQRDERVLMSYSFETLPQLIYETMERLADLLARKAH